MNGNTYLADFAIATTMILGITMLIFYLLGQDRIREFLLDTGEKMTLIILPLSSKIKPSITIPILIIFCNSCML